MNEREPDHWLVRPETIRWIWRVSLAVLAITVLLQLVIKIKGYFGAAFGFLSCLAMVLVAKGLGFLLKRDEDYYRRDPADD